MDPNVTDETNVTAEAASSIIDFYKEHAPLAVAMDRLVTPIFYLIGLPANPLCAYIWLGARTRRHNSSAIYLGSLSLSHTMFLTLHVFIELNYAWGIKTFDGYVWCEVFYILYYLPQYLAPLLVLGFTVERYIAVCHPFVKERCCTVRRALHVTLIFVLACLALSGVQGYLWTYDPDFRCCNHRPSLQRTPFPYYWTWVTELTLFGLAPLAALVFNVLVLREIRDLTARGPAGVVGGGVVVGGEGGGGGGGGSGNQASTVTLLSVSFYLICTWLPATLVYSLERQFPFGESPYPRGPVWRRHFTYYTVRKLVEEVTLSNSACYFFIYCLTGRHFRSRFKEIVCPAACRQASRDLNGLTNGRSLSSRHYIAVPCPAGNGHSTCVSTV
ncbi:galanin receptor 2a-like [Babylonia areolata]|uniref:galanin receptor 2a-like n=1 Tax=Babylonia areolata TaxID=304850 RepID=UPI003FD50D0E